MNRAQTQTRPSEPESGGFSLSIDDIFYALFRHKWKIVILTVLGLGAAAAYYVTAPKPYASVAQLLVRYVQEGQGPTSTGDERIKSPDARGGDSIINAEMNIVKSLDIARSVAETVGPERILENAGGGNDLGRATSLVSNGLEAANPKRTGIISLRFQHPDAAMVQPILNAVIEAYLKRHVEIHRPAGTFDDFLTQQTDQLRARLAQTEEELRKARSKAGIISLEDTRRAQSESINGLKRQLLDSQRLLAEKNAAAHQMLKLSSGATPATSTNPDSKESPAQQVSPSIVDNYRNTLTLLAQLRERERALLQQFTPESTRVQSLRAQIADVEQAKSDLENATPGLLTTPQASLPLSTAQGPSQETMSLAASYAELAGIEATIKTLTEQLAQVRAEAAELDSLESNIQELERRKVIEETNYRSFAANLERTRMEEALGAGRVTNISRIQNPSPGFQDVKKTKQIAMGIGASGLVFGLALALAIELFLDRTIRRASQVEKKLGLDVFMSIPARTRRATKKVKESSALALQNESAPPWEPANALHAYYTALRDRTISFFESRNLHHKPRLVALTGLGKDHGAAEIASGLAGCLSETGEGKVLFVDMTTNQGAAQQFYQGQSVSSIDEALQSEDKAKVASNLYVVSNEGTTNGSHDGSTLPLILPKRFSHLVPKLRASDFDYIIFNLPPVNNLSVTPRLAQHMDVVLMVMEAEKTDAYSAEKAKALLGNSKAHIGAILNKTKDYVPRSLIKELN
ncbi:MAG: Wzz/FepE/Etk N-terminal domain-containing protein [Opitutaceae bacterium]|nr:Wzz/FepE/Etk N-terminal domain-containing protein [Opitutaceae bacterium]